MQSRRSRSPPLPVYTPTLDTAIHEHAQEHLSLHAALDPLLGLPELIVGREDQLYILKGQLMSRQTELKQAQIAYDAAVANVKKIKGPVMLSKRRTRYHQAQSRVEELVSQRDSLQSRIVELTEDIRSRETQLGKMKMDAGYMGSLEQQLDSLDYSLFGGYTALYPFEDRVESQVAVLAATTKFVIAEADRETRARDQLIAALACFEAVLAGLKKALSITLTIGVPNNTKHAHQLFSNNSSLGTAKSVTPLVQRAKNDSGKGHVLYAQARGGQRLIRPLPLMTLMELERMPGKAIANTMKKELKEQDIQASLETSYAQVTAVVSHIKRERTRSKERTTYFKKRAVELKAEQRRAELRLREVRKRIVVGITQHQGVVQFPQDDEDIRLHPEGEDDDDDEATLAEGPDVEEEIFQAEAEALDEQHEDNMYTLHQDAAGNPIPREDGELTIDSRGKKAVKGAPLLRTAGGRLSSASSSSNAAAGDASFELLLPSAPHADGAKLSTDLPEGHPLDPSVIAHRSTRALRKVIRQCVREVNRGDDFEVAGWGTSTLGS